ncbi:MAG TPA: hypothetical protein VIJ68_03250 [Candidatus Saccharimonadales bacterium]
MSDVRSLYERGRDVIQDPYASAVVAAGSLLVNVLYREPLVVYANESFGEQMKKALPSALPADKVSEWQPANVGFQMAYSAAAFES